MSVGFELVEITPEMAQEYLDAQPPNRALRRNRVAEFASDMRNGRWAATPQPVMLNSDGVMIDGQHRMAAVVLSGRTVAMWIARGVDDSHRQFVDGGTPRTTRDVFSLRGMDYGTHSSAAARLVLSYGERLDIQWNSVQPTIGKQAIINEVLGDEATYQRFAAQAVAVNKVGVRRGYLRPSAYCALGVLVSRESQFPELWDEFHLGVVTGANLPHGDPRLVLRNGSSQFTGAQFALQASLKCWAGFVRAESMTRIKTGPKYLPMPEVI